MTELRKIALEELVSNTGQIDGVKANPRFIRDKYYKRLVRSLRKSDLTDIIPLKVYPWQGQYVTIGGNMRLRALQEIGVTEVSCIVIPSDTPAEVLNKAVILDNSTYGEWDMDMLANEWSDEPLEDWGLDVPTSWGGSEEEAQEDDFDEEKDKVETVCKKGDIWLLGQHRLMCGDSTNAEDVAALLDGESVSMLLTDPPYGMHLDADFSSIKGRLSGETKGNKYDAVIGDNDDFKPELITTLFDNIDCKECFLFGADYFAELLPHKNDGSWLVWDKRKESQANAIGSEFELIWSKTKHKRRVLRHDWFGFLSSQNGSDARHRVHPTQKPITLIADIINQWGGKAQSIADLYGGSGSTLIACEQLGRKCYMMELDPHYCDVIIARWEKMTNNRAIKL